MTKANSFLRVAGSAAVAGAIGAWSLGYLMLPWQKVRETPPHEVYPDPFYIPRDWVSPWGNIQDRGAFLSMIRSQNRALKVVDLRRSPHASNAVLHQVVSLCPNVEELRVSDTFGHVTDPMMAALALGCQFLRLVDFSNLAGGVTDEGLKALYEICKDVESLRMSGCGLEHTITEASLKDAIRRYGKQLKHLEYGGDISLSDSALQLIAQHCPNLEMLNVGAGYSDITDEGALAVLRACTKLRQLDVGGMNGVTDKTLAHLADPKFAPQLQVFMATSTLHGGKVAEQTITDLKMLRPSLHVYNVETDRSTTSHSWL